ATAVRERGLGGRRVALVPGEAADFITQFFALLVSGTTIVPLPPKTPVDDLVEYRDRVAGLIARARPEAVITPSGDDVAGAAAMRLPTLADLDGLAPGEVIDPGPDHLALI